MNTSYAAQLLSVVHHRTIPFTVWIAKLLRCHGALLVYNAVAFGNLVMVLAARKYEVLPVFGFVLLIDALYGIIYRLYSIHTIHGS
jgi:hypothetical protein